MNLSTLLESLSLKEVSGNTQQNIERIDFDSRQVQAGSLFVAVPGTNVDGHEYIETAVERGAKVIVAERPRTDWAELPPALTWVRVPNSATALGWLAAAFYGHPSRALKLVGVTGTNGKTTVVTVLYDLFNRLGYRVGLLSTVEVRIGRQQLAATHTTPDAVQIQATLARMRDAGCDFAFMEVSSHAADQDRIAGLHFAGGVFTNMSHDHLDYHGTFRAYIDAKKKFFDILPATAFALINIDDKRGSYMVQNTAATVHRYSLRSLAEYRAKVLENTPQGILLRLGEREVQMRMIGEFNGYNLLAAFGVADLLEQSSEEVLSVLSLLPGAAGRLEPIYDPHSGRTAVVDYAHTPDALEKVLQALRELQKASGGQLLTVVGAGGDRDRAKRPKMAAVAIRLSDQLILTSDNPRSEDPESILDAMEAGIPAADRHRYLRITDRKSAIRTAVRLAKRNDLVLIAGKGHETYQEIKGIKHPFDDRIIAAEALRLEVE